MAQAPEVYNPNLPEPGEPSFKGSEIARFPTIPGAFSSEQYASAFSELLANKSMMFEVSKVGVAGAIDAPEMQSFSRLSQMPNAFTKGLVQWPGLPAATLKKIAAENYIVHAIIQQRIADVGRYSEVSTHPWKPGWAIELRGGHQSPNKSDLTDIQDATRFVLNCNSEFGNDARKRDEAQLTSWKNFLAASVRDTLRYDGIAWWTDMDLRGRVRAFKCLPAGNIMLATRDGFEGDKKIFACGVDEAGTIKHKFTRNDLTWIIRNERSDAEVFRYGYPESEMALRLIQGFTNAFDMNADIFTKDATPQGILKLKGMWPQRQVEVISRIWMNLKRGPTKKWALPAIPVPKDGDIELLDMSRMKDNDVYYSDFINMLAGLYCTIYGFPVNRLGYRISGAGKDSEAPSDQTAATLVDQADPALEPLLGTLETSFNEYILWTRWPHLQLTFRGKNPKEDARSYELRKNASTFNEVRALSDRPKLEDEAETDHKELAQLMGMAPVDPGLTGVWQTISSAYLSAKHEAEHQTETPGALIKPKNDPAKSESKGHLSGVRRNSAAEAKTSE